jgi:beta-lactamase class A
MKRSLLILFAFTSAFATEQPLERRLQAMADAHHGKVALYAEGLRTGKKIAINADVEVPTASTIKLPIFMEAFRQVKAGRLKLTEKIVMRKDDQVEGSGQLQYFQTPLAITLQDALTMMMIESDNTATNLVIDRVGRANVNHWLADHGFDHTYLYKKVFKPAEKDVPADQPKFGLGKTTAAEMAGVLKLLHTCELGDDALCTLMLGIMKKQAYRNMVPHYIEANVDISEQPSEIADKIGALDESRSDVALIFTERGPILISAYTFENQDHRWSAENEAELLIARMAKAIYGAWGKAKAGKKARVVK